MSTITVKDGTTIYYKDWGAVVDLGLASGTSPGSTEQRAMRAVCGYLLYAG